MADPKMPARWGVGLAVFQPWVDKVTGRGVEPGAPGAVPTKRWVVAHEGHLYDVKPEHFNIDQPRYTLHPSGAKEVWNQLNQSIAFERREKKQRKRKKQGRKSEGVAAVPEVEFGARATFRSAGAAASEFMDNNAELVEGLAAGDVGDALHDWMDGFEVKRGRSWKKANKTAKGKEILAEVGRRGSGTTWAVMHELLTWLFSQAFRKRWEDAPWGLIDSLADDLTPSCEDRVEQQGSDGERCGSWEWYPIASGQLDREQILHRLPEHAQVKAADAINQKELIDLVKQARRAVKEAKGCIGKEDAELMKSRLALLADMSKRPELISGAVCGNERARVCGFEAVKQEVARIKRACKRAIHDEGQAVSMEERDEAPFPTSENPKKKRAKYRAIVWTKGRHTSTEAGPHVEWDTWNGDGYRIAGHRQGMRRWFGLHRDSPPAERIKGPGGNGFWSTLTAAKAAANKHRRAYLAAKKKATRTSKANPTNPWGTLTDLEAKVIELEVRRPDGKVSIHTWHTNQPRLYWSPTRKALVFIHNGTKPKQLGAQAPPGKAADVFKRWTNRRATDAAELSIPAEPLKVAGPALRIVYKSKRYRDGIPRHHDFGSGVLVRKAPSGNACTWQVSGGKLKATKRGLVG